MTLPRTCCAECGAPLRLQRMRRKSNEPADVAPLSRREMQVFSLYARGLMPADIAEELGIDVKTVSTYRTRLLHKLGVASTAELTRLAVRLGIR